MTKLIFATIIALALLTACCAPALQALEAVSRIAQGSQWLSSVLDVAETGAKAYFDRHPNRDKEIAVEAALRRARRAMAALDSVLSSARALDARDGERARNEALAAYAELRELLSDFGVLGAVPPEGGAETEAPVPVPLRLPTDAEVATKL